MLLTTNTTVPIFLATSSCIDFASSEGFYLGDSFGSPAASPRNPSVIFNVEFRFPGGGIFHVPVTYDQTSGMLIARGMPTGWLPPLPPPFQIGQHLVVNGGVIGFDFSGFPVKVTNITFTYFEQYGRGGGGVSLLINGSPHLQPGGLGQLPTPFELGGATIGVTSYQLHEAVGPSGTILQSGVVALDGQVEVFEIGADELGLDRICLQFDRGFAVE